MKTIMRVNDAFRMVDDGEEDDFLSFKLGGSKPRLFFAFCQTREPDKHMRICGKFNVTMFVCSTP